MSYYSVVTNYSDHTATVEFPTIAQAITEFNYRQALITEIDPTATVRALRISEFKTMEILSTAWKDNA